MAELSVLEGAVVVEEASGLVEAVFDAAEVTDEAPVDEAALVALEVAWEVAVLVFRVGRLLRVVGFWAAARVAAKASIQSALFMVERLKRTTFGWAMTEDQTSRSCIVSRSRQGRRRWCCFCFCVLFLLLLLFEVGSIMHK